METDFKDFLPLIECFHDDATWKFLCNLCDPNRFHKEDRQEGERGKKKSDYFNQFQGSSVMLHGGAVGTETEEEGVLLKWAVDLICTFQVWQ